jgi:hypothetical protein
LMKAIVATKCILLIYRALQKHEENGHFSEEEI